MKINEKLIKELSTDLKNKIVDILTENKNQNVAELMLLVEQIEFDENGKVLNKEIFEQIRSTVGDDGYYDIENIVDSFLTNRVITVKENENSDKTEYTKEEALNAKPDDCLDAEIWNKAVNATFTTGRDKVPMKELKQQYRYNLKNRNFAHAKYASINAKNNEKDGIDEGLHKIKRKWRGDAYPAVHINPAAAMRNKIIEFIGEGGGKTYDEFKEYCRTMTEDESIGKSPNLNWLSQNKKIVKIIEVGKKKYVRLTEIGKRIYRHLMKDKEEINEVDDSPKEEEIKIIPKKKGGWTTDELEVATKLLAQKLYMTKIYLDGSYAVYNVPFDDGGVTHQNCVLTTGDIDKVKALIKESTLQNTLTQIKDGATLISNMDCATDSVHINNGDSITILKREGDNVEFMVSGDKEVHKATAIEIASACCTITEDLKIKTRVGPNTIYGFTGENDQVIDAVAQLTKIPKENLKIQNYGGDVYAIFAPNKGAIGTYQKDNLSILTTEIKEHKLFEALKYQYANIKPEQIENFLNIGHYIELDEFDYNRLNKAISEHDLYEYGNIDSTKSALIDRTSNEVVAIFDTTSNKLATAIQISLDDLIQKVKNSEAIIESIDNPQKLGTTLKKFFKSTFGLTISTRSISTSRGFDNSYYEITTDGVFPNEIRQKAVLKAYDKTIDQKDELDVSDWNNISYGNIRTDRISIFGKGWVEILAEYGITEKLNEDVNSSSYTAEMNKCAVAALNESFEAEAANDIDDIVNFLPMYRHCEMFGIADDERRGTIVNIKFTKAKVFYDILDDYLGVIFDMVDSAKVFSSQAEIQEFKFITGLKDLLADVEGGCEVQQESNDTINLVCDNETSHKFVVTSPNFKTDIQAFLFKNFRIPLAKSAPIIDDKIQFNPTPVTESKINEGFTLPEVQAYVKNLCDKNKPFVGGQMTTDGFYVTYNKGKLLGTVRADGEIVVKELESGRVISNNNYTTFDELKSHFEKFYGFKMKESLQESGLLAYMQTGVSSGMISERTGVSDYIQLSRIKKKAIEMLKLKDHDITTENITEILNQAKRAIGIKESKAMVNPLKISFDELTKLASEYGLDISSYDEEQIKKGLKVESEHGSSGAETDVTHDDIITTLKIVVAHLKEDSVYYNKLETIEK